MAQVLFWLVAMIAITALVLSIISFIDAHSDTFGTIKTNRLQSNNSANTITVPSDMQLIRVATTPHGGDLSALSIHINSAPVGYVLATFPGPALESSVTLYQDIFTGATSTSGNPNKGIVLPANYQVGGTLILYISGQLGTTPSNGNAYNIYLQNGNTGTATVIWSETGVTSANASSSFFTQVTLSGDTNGSLASVMFGTGTTAGGNASVLYQEKTGLNPALPGQIVNVYLGLTADASDIQIDHAYLRYYPEL